MLYWTQFIRDCQASGLSVRAFCESAGVLESRYYYWQKKLRDSACELLLLETAGDDSRAAFVPQGFAAVVLDDAPTLDEKSAPLMPIVQNDTGSAALLSDTSPALLAHSTPSLSSAPETRERPAGQIKIEVSGIKISADGTYPVDKLSRVLRGLHKS
jgi:hypothetical protein